MNDMILLFIVLIMLMLCTFVLTFKEKYKFLGDIGDNDYLLQNVSLLNKSQVLLNNKYNKAGSLYKHKKKKTESVIIDDGL